MPETPDGVPTSDDEVVGAADSGLEIDAALAGDAGDDANASAAAASLADVDVELLLQERADYLAALQRLQAEFENYKKRMIRQQTEVVERAAGVLVERLLPALDTFDLALGHGAEAVEPVYRSLIAVLEGEGLERIDPVGQPFDPNEHDAVAHEPGDVDHPEVLEVLRAGYRWKGRILRPAMVKVKG